MVVSIPVTAELSDHVRRKLLTCSPAIAQQLGRVSVKLVTADLIVPAGMTAEELVAWTSGKGLDVGGIGGHGATAELARYLRQRTAVGVDRTLVCINQLAHPSDPWVATVKQQVLCGDDVVYQLAGPGSLIQVISATITEAESAAGFIGIVVSEMKLRAFLNKQAEPSEFIHVIVAGAEAVIVDAFDGEGYLACMLGCG